MRDLCVILLSGLIALPVSASVDGPFEAAVITLAGVSSMEDLSEGEIELYLHFREHPIDLNSASESRLRSSGLLDELQLSSLLRTRRETGDIMSYSELSLLSGFGTATAEALKLFTVLHTVRAPGQLNRGGVHGGATAKAAVRDGEAAYGLKAALSVGESAELRWASRTTYADPHPSPGTVSAAYYGRSFPGKVILGDFAARFGQGLVQWSGFRISSLGTPASLVRNASGLSATSSVTSALCGMAGDCSLGRLQLSAGVSFKGAVEPVANAAYRFDNASVSLTGTRSALGLDWRVGLPGGSFFGEVCWKGGPAAVAGIYCVPRYGSRLALRLGVFSPEYGREYSGLALSYAGRVLTAGLDGGWCLATSVPQVKSLLQASLPPMSAGGLSIAASLRASCRYRPMDGTPLRTGLRSDIALGCGESGLNLRFDVLRHRGTAWLLYCEPHVGGSRVSLHGRWTLFRVDSWDDRIYVYERDIPWSFSVPAYYGRGESFSLYGRCSLNRWAACLRVSFLHYPWNAAPKPARAELKLQLERKW